MNELLDALKLVPLDRTQKLPGWDNELADNAIQNALKRLGFVYFDKGEHNLNVIAIKNDINPRKNEFDDLLTVSFYSMYGGVRRKNVWAWECTTEPGTHWLKNPISEAAKSGAAIWKCPQQVRGSHRYSIHSLDHWGLVQVKPIEIVRDNNWNDIPETAGMKTTSGLYYCNIHGSYGDKKVNNQSAGCIATKAAYTSEVYRWFQTLLQTGANVWGNSFTTTIIPASALFDGSN